MDLLPSMKTDITLTSDEKKIVIDTKFYQETVALIGDKERFHSENMYQLYAYLRSLESDNRSIMNSNCEGLLLYPTVDSDFNESYLIDGHIIRIATVDLSRDWREIHQSLLQLIQ